MSARWSRRRLRWLALVLAGPLAVAAAVVPAPGRVDARVREVEYREQQVVQLTGYVGYHLDLELERGERFVALGAGDAAALEIAAEGSHVFLKPKAARVNTNLTLLSNRRVYRFEYRAVAGPPAAESVLYALRFRYPAAVSTVTDSVAGAAPGAAGTASPGTDAAAPPPNTDYWYCGSPWLQPTDVSDDGVQTRITFAARGEWPAIFVRNADGSEALVNFHVQGTTAVVHRVAPAFVLRRGRLVGCLENRGFAGSGAWQASGTRAAGTLREVRP